MVLPASHRVSRAPWYSGSVSLSFFFRVRGSHTLRLAFPNDSARIQFHFVDCPHPLVRRLRFGLFPFRSPLLWKSLFVFSSFGYLDVSVPRVPLHSLCIQLWMTGHYSSRVSPFGHLRIYTCLQFPVAFRSLPRPSSAPSAKAFALCSY